MKDKLAKNNHFVNFFALLTSMSTLLCCALPALLVSLGLGATMVSLTSAFPQIIWLGEHKVMLFSGSFVILVIASFLAYQNRNAPCPIDPALRDACIRGRKWTKFALILSWIILTIGFFFSYLAIYFF